MSQAYCMRGVHVLKGALCVQIVYDVLAAIDKKIKDSAAERAEFRKVTIKNEGTIPIGTPQQAEMKNED